MAKGPGGGGARPYYDGKGDDSWGQRRWRPWFVATVVAANVAMFAVTMYINDCPGHRMPFGPCIGAGYFHRFAFQPLRQNPLVGPSASTLEHLGALEWIKVVKHHEEWRLLTCIWLHAGVFHLLANMLCLLFIGIRLEEQFGFVRIGIIYFVSGFGGSILSSLFIGSNISIGASGALLGLLGAMLSELITNWAIYSNKAAALLSLMFVVAVNLALGILPHVDNFAHIGGFITGFLLGFVLLIQPQAGWMEQSNLSQTRRAKHKYKAYQWALLVIAVLLLMAGLAVGLLLLFHGERLNGHCDWCRYLDCIPTSR